MASLNVSISGESIIKTLNIADEKFVSIMQYNNNNLNAVQMPTLEEEILKRKPKWLENLNLLSAVWFLDTSNEVEKYLDQLTIINNIETNIL